MRISGGSVQLFELLQAGGAEALFVEDYDIPVGITKNAGGNVLFQNDAVALHEELHLVPHVDVQGFPHLLGQHDAPQLVHDLQDSR